MIFQSCKHFGSKFCFENSQDVVGVVSEVDVAVPTRNCSDIFFKKWYSLTRAASFFLNTSYLFGSRYFLLSLSAYFLAGSLTY